MVDDRTDRQTVVNDLAFARPGDKGDDSDVTVFARSQQAYDILVDQLTADAVKAWYGDLVGGEVTRWEVPNVLALKFLLRDALGGGGPSSLRADNLGKALAGAVLRMPLEGIAHPPAPRAPADPYAGEDWPIGD